MLGVKTAFKGGPWRERRQRGDDAEKREATSHSGKYYASRAGKGIQPFLERGTNWKEEEGSATRNGAKR